MDSKNSGMWLVLSPAWRAVRSHSCVNLAVNRPVETRQELGVSVETWLETSAMDTVLSVSTPMSTPRLSLRTCCVPRTVRTRVRTCRREPVISVSTRCPRPPAQLGPFCCYTPSCNTSSKLRRAVFHGQPSCIPFFVVAACDLGCDLPPIPAARQ
jgi:hypothetical protein